MGTTLKNIIKQLEKHSYILLSNSLPLTDFEVQALAPPLTKPTKRLKSFEFEAKVVAKLRSMNLDDRISWHRRRCAKEIKIYEILDRILQNNITTIPLLYSKLKDVKQEILIVNRYILIQESTKFKKLRKQQHELVNAVLRTVEQRQKATVEEHVLSFLRKEVILIDLLLSVDLQIQDFCKSYGVSGQGFAEAGNLVTQVWGIKSRELLKLIGKD